MKRTFLILIYIGFWLISFGQERKKVIAIPADTINAYYFDLELDSNNEILKLYYVLDSTDSNHCQVTTDYLKNKKWSVFTLCPVKSSTLSFGNRTRTATKYKMHGENYLYTPNGNLTSITHFDHGKRLKNWESISYYSNGSVWSVAERKGNKMHGIDSVFYDTGVLYYVAEYENDKLLNFIKYFDPKGNVVEISEFKNGNGKLPTFNSCDSEVEITYFKNGKPKK